MPASEETTHCGEETETSDSNSLYFSFASKCCCLVITLMVCSLPLSVSKSIYTNGDF